MPSTGKISQVIGSSIARYRSDERYEGRNNPSGIGLNEAANGCIVTATGAFRIGASTCRLSVSSTSSPTRRSAPTRRSRATRARLRARAILPRPSWFGLRGSFFMCVGALSSLRGLGVGMMGGILALTLQDERFTIPRLIHAGAWLTIGVAAGSLLAGLQRHPRRAHRITRHANDAMLLAEKIKRLDGFFGEADDAFGREHG